MAIDIKKVVLPKWPQMLVWGKSVTQEQAYEIIVRTDSFLISLDEYSGGNNKRWNEWARNALGFNSALAAIKLAAPDNAWQLRYDVVNRLMELSGFVDTAYVTNSWASSAFVFGPHGWCSPEGKIEYVDNVGKWPSAEDILSDWEKIANAFRYLDLTVTLMDGEGCEEDRTALVSFRVLDGQVTVMDPVLPPVAPVERDVTAVVSRITSGRDSEQGLPDDWIVQRGIELAPLIEQAISEAMDNAMKERA